MTEKRKLSAKQVLEDVKGGLSDDDLMSKHRLTARELQGVLRKLVEAGWLTQSQLDARTAIFEEPTDVGPPEEERGKQSVTREADSIIFSSLFAGLATGWAFAQVSHKELAVVYYLASHSQFYGYGRVLRIPRKIQE